MTLRALEFLGTRALAPLGSVELRLELLEDRCVPTVDFSLLDDLGVTGVASGPVEFFVTEDFNGDGYLDIVSAQLNEENDSVPEFVMFLGNEAGGFDQAELEFDHLVFALKAGDFNDDGRPDLLGAQLGNDIDDSVPELVLIPGDGEGGFDDPITLDDAPSLEDVDPEAGFAIFVDDFNGDHLDDLIFLFGNEDDDDKVTSTLTFFAGDGQNFSTVDPVTIDLGPMAFLSAQILDFDDDGDLDILALTPEDNSISLLENDGVGNFSTQQVITDALFAGLTELKPSAMLAGDYNSDGHVDLLLFGSDDEDQTFTFIPVLADGDGGFLPGEAMTVAEGGILADVNNAFLNNDLFLDVVAVQVVLDPENKGLDDGLSSRVVGLENDGTGAFSVVVLAEPDKIINAVVVADIDHDFDDDLILLTLDQDDMDALVLQNNGPVGFVVASFRAILGRDPSADELETFESLRESEGEQTVTQTLWESEEHRRLQIDEFYFTLYGRRPDDAGMEFWLSAFLDGGVDEQRVIADMLRSDELATLAFSNEQLIQNVYQALHGFGPTDSELQSGLNQLENGNTLPDVFQSFFSDQDGARRTARGLYVRLLGRPGDESGLSAWANGLMAGSASFTDLAITFLASDEFVMSVTT